MTIRRNGHELAIALGEVEVGDHVLVRSGERIAVDGHVVAGTAAINQAAITGESVAVDRAAGDTVYAGTLNELGAIEVAATSVGAETTLGQIRRMVAEAQDEKAPIERILDRYAKFYPPIALVLGGLIWWWSGDILRAITMLIVFCPCVMVLATPTALVASIGNAALRGSLVKKGATVESMAQVDTVVFDKTGTLTFGRPHLVSARPLGAVIERDLLRLAAAAEKFSEHPVARAVVIAAESAGIGVPDPDDFEVLPGLGVRATVEGTRVLLGRPDLLESHGIDGLPREQVDELSAAGRTMIAVAVGDDVVGLLALEDEIRPEARDVVAALSREGVRTVLVTGDNRATAERVAADVGIGEVHADVLPRRKVEIVRELQSQGRTVAFVGDGVNDGPALAGANVGVAMGLAGTDVAIETAELALLADDLSKLPHLLRLSRRALSAIRQNLVFSLGVLAIAVGLTIPGILTPVTGALLHELSSIPVIANSARLIGLKQSD